MTSDSAPSPALMRCWALRLLVIPAGPSAWGEVVGQSPQASGDRRPLGLSMTEVKV